MGQPLRLHAVHLMVATLGATGAMTSSDVTISQLALWRSWRDAGSVTRRDGSLCHRRRRRRTQAEQATAASAKQRNTSAPQCCQHKGTLKAAHQL